jgi:hypothetical protein
LTHDAPSDASGRGTLTALGTEAPLVVMATVVAMLPLLDDLIIVRADLPGLETTI